jgi:hypothetical protein
MRSSVLVAFFFTPSKTLIVMGGVGARPSSIYIPELTHQRLLLLVPLSSVGPCSGESEFRSPQRVTCRFTGFVLQVPLSAFIHGSMVLSQKIGEEDGSACSWEDGFDPCTRRLVLPLLMRKKHDCQGFCLCLEQPSA